VEILKQIIKSSSFVKFEKLIQTNRLSHSFLISSEDEEYNKQFCKAITLRLACDKKTQGDFNMPCFSCDNCLKILSGFHPDILIYPQKNTFLVEDSESILKNIAIKPMLTKYKIFLINNINKSTIQAQNKILKILEDAPKNVIFLLNTTDTNNVLQTVISRTQIFNLEPLNADAISKILMDKNGSLDYIAIKLGDGWLGKTFALANEKTLEVYDFVLNLLTNMKSSKNIINYVSKFSQKEGFITRLNILQEILEKVLYAHFSLSEDEKIQSLTKIYSIDCLYEILNLIVLSKKQFNANVSTILITDYLLFKILEVKYLCSLKK